VSINRRGEEIVVISTAAVGVAGPPLQPGMSADQEEECDADTKLRNVLGQVDPSLQWAIEELDLPEDGGTAIATKIRSGKGRCISDGSLKELFGTSAFKFMMGKMPTYIGRNRVPGTDRDQDSYRSELCGMLGNVIMINAICEAHNITETYDMTMGCDNISALWKSFDDADTRQTDASSDILMAIRYQMKKLPLNWKSKWVPGHQDDGETPTVLDEWAW
jgi:hypothetical protein